MECTVTTVAVIPKVCPAYPKGWATSSKGIRGYIRGSVDTFLSWILRSLLYFNYRNNIFVKNNRGAALIGGVFISSDL
jgi:hypothetical protein